MPVKRHSVLNGENPFGRSPDFPITTVRAIFPALNRRPEFMFFDNAAGAQVPQVVLDAVNHHLLECNVQRGGRYAKSRAVDEMILRARQSVADLVNARDSSEIAFGMNATSFIRLVSLAIGQTLGKRNEIVVTDMDHEANVATWLALERTGAKIVWWKMREDGNLQRRRFDPSGVARNAPGGLYPCFECDWVDCRCRCGGESGACCRRRNLPRCVHFGPHGLIDVQAFECDFLVCSGYKMFAPHMGFLWGRCELLQQLPTFREDFIPDEPPGKIEAGTFIYENVAGMDAAVQYLESLGRIGVEEPRRTRLQRAFASIRAYEETLSLEMLRVLNDAGAEIYGITSEDRIRERVPTLCFNLPNISPARVTEELAKRDIGVRDGHMYSPRLMRRLGAFPKRRARSGRRWCTTIRWPKYRTLQAHWPRSGQNAD